MNYYAMARASWSLAEISHLRQHYSTASIVEIAVALRRSPSAVYSKARKLKLRMPASRNDALDSDIRSRYPDEGSLKIAAEHDLKRKAVVNRAFILGVKCRRTRHPRDQRTRIAIAVLAGMTSYGRAAAAYGVSRNTVAGIVSRHRVAIRNGTASI